MVFQDLFNSAMAGAVLHLSTVEGYKMNWIKKQTYKIAVFIGVCVSAFTGGIYFSGQHAYITPTSGRHFLKPDFTRVATPIFPLDSGERFISIKWIEDIATGKVKRVTADTLDTDTDMNILTDFIQCKK